MENTMEGVTVTCMRNAIVILLETPMQTVQWNLKYCCHGKKSTHTDRQTSDRHTLEKFNKDSVLLDPKVNLCFNGSGVEEEKIVKFKCQVLQDYLLVPR